MDPTDTTEAPVSDEAPPAGRSRTPMLVGLVLVVAVVAVVAGGVALLLSSGDDGRSTSTPPSIPAVDDRVTVAPGQAIQPIVDAAQPGTTFLLEAGVHREQQVNPRPGDVFEGVGDETVLNGARILDGWATDATGWSVGGQTQQGFVQGQCRATSPRCGHPEELFLDGERLEHVGALDDVGADSWFFDYDADRIHIGTDPTGRVVETSVTPFAFTGDALGVTIRNLTVTHYATQTQYGTIHAEGTDWTIEGVSAIDNHATGIFLAGDRGVIRDSRSIGNGALGVGGTGFVDGRMERTEVADNNAIGVDYDWEGGGAKFTLTTNMAVTDSYVHDNDGPGIWFDESAVDSTITGNRVVDNQASGIFYEISKGATITDNEVTGNGFGEKPKRWAWGGGIQIAASWDVLIEDNDVRGNYRGVILIQQERGTGPLGARLVDDVMVKDNRIEPDGGLTGAATDLKDTDFFERNLKFEDNSYEVDDTTKAFTWDGQDYDLAGWESLGMS